MVNVCAGAALTLYCKSPPVAVVMYAGPVVAEPTLVAYAPAPPVAATTLSVISVPILST